jgi:hypothetical protein
VYDRIDPIVTAVTAALSSSRYQSASLNQSNQATGKAMKTIFAAAVIALAIGAASAHAGWGSNGSGLNGSGLNGSGFNGSGLNGSGLNGSGLNGTDHSGLRPAAGPTIGSADLIVIELPR